MFLNRRVAASPGVRSLKGTTRRTALLIGTTALLAVSFLAAAASWPSGTVGVTELPPTRIGDQIAYGEFERSSSHGMWRPSGSVEVSVLGQTQALDAEFRVRNPLVLEVQRGHGTSVVHLDPQRRQVVREQTVAAAEEASAWAGTKETVRFPASSESIDPWLRNLFAWPGTTFSAESGAEPWLAVLEDALPLPETVRTLPGTESWRWERALLDDRTVLVLQSFSNLESGGFVEREVWLGPEPYPLGFLLTIRQVSSPDIEFQHQIRLASYVPGTSILRKGLGNLDGPVYNAQPQTGGFPQEGPSAGLVASFDQALRTLDEDPTFVGYRLWRERNPDAALVGYSLVPYEFQHPTDRTLLGARMYSWKLSFMGPAGNGVLEIVNVDEDGRPLLNKDEKRELQWPAEIYQLRKNGFVTLSQAQHVWNLLSPDYGSFPSLNYVHWGYTAECRQGYGPEDCVADPFGALQIGFHGPYEAGNQGLPILRWSHTILTIDATTGRPFDFVITRDAAAHFEHDSPPAPFPSTATSQPAALRMLPVDPKLPFATYAAAVSIATLFAIAFYSARRVLGLILWPAYAKITRSELLNHETRNTILVAIRERPGVTPTDLRDLGIAPWSTLIYHLGRLEDEDLVRVQKEGPAKRYYDASTVTPNEAQRHAVLHSSRAATLLRFVAERPGITQVDLARSLAMRAPSMLRHIRRLERAGVLRSQRSGGRVQYFVA